MNKLSQINIYPDEGFRGQGPLGLEGTSPSEAPSVFENVISSTVGVLTVVGFIILLIMLLSGAIQLMTSGGDKQKVAQARSRMTIAVIGIVVVIAGIFIARFIATLIGLENIFDIPAVINSLSP